MARGRRQTLMVGKKQGSQRVKGEEVEQFHE
jgi:hypothetical protein